MSSDKGNLGSALIRLNRYLNMLAQSGGLSGARMQVLAIIKDKNPVTLRQLCDIQQVKMPTMSKLVDELQNGQLVIRAQSKDDARKRWIVPTQKGLQVLAQAQQENKKRWQTILKEFSQQDLELMESQIDQLCSGLSKHLEGES
ncbi:MarR family winged helix-turn-helix transcriptional regulator [Aliikangiella sp. G2MR2-5]|uniref:MarR family winged helix-turn-helix transcriptional regulator n=1 Tax=Aliikangiella sp. G2MR2-5 TaxID=2788943 RepID=UPI0018AADC14|nr:MarR family winged helix-turn-helix transcriptional regulator [Aliikangiella sp. G2MR2-5]